MKIIRDGKNLPKNWDGASVTTGSFDSLHEGHCQLIFECIKHARRNGIPSVLITFEQCRSLIASNTKKYTSHINSLRRRFLVLRDLGLDYLFLLKFNKKLVSTSATLFIKKVLVKELRTKIFIVGDDFQFGRMKLGDASLLHNVEENYALQIVKRPTLVYKNERISSSRIRFHAGKENSFVTRSILGRF